MKRTWIFVTLLCCLFLTPGMSSANSVTAMAVEMEDELPWTTVEAIFQDIENETSYTFGELVQWYSDELMDIELVDSNYKVTVLDGGSNPIVVILGNL